MPPSGSGGTGPPLALLSIASPSPHAMRGTGPRLAAAARREKRAARTAFIPAAGGHSWARIVADEEDGDPAMRRLAILLAALLSLPASADEIRMLGTGASKAIVEAMARQFEARTGHRILLTTDTAGGATRRMQAGEAYDVVMIVPAAIDALAERGRIVRGTRRDIASVRIGVGVREGDPVPDISTLDAFVAALRAAPRIAYVDPAAGATSGIHFRAWLERAGLAAEMAPKTRLQAGGYVAELVARGEADLVVHQVSEILPVRGVRMIGPVPDAIQLVTTYSAGLSADARDPALARAFLDHMAGPEAEATIRAAGMTLPAR
jgi:molybdate transport system substrate-binding protein